MSNKAGHAGGHGIRRAAVEFHRAEALLGETWNAVRSRHPTRGAQEYVQAHWGRYVWMLASLGPIRPGMRVLEIGASIVSSALKRAGAEVSVAYHELEPEWEARFAAEGINGFPVELLRDGLPFAPESFDLILCDQVLEHLPLSYDFLLKQMLGVLVPEGTLAISTPNFAAWEKRWALLRGKNPQDALDSVFLYYSHHREPVMGELCGDIRRCGGRIRSFHWTDFAPPQRPVGRLSGFMKNLAARRWGPLLHALVPGFRDYLVVFATVDAGFRPLKR